MLVEAEDERRHVRLVYVSRSTHRCNPRIWLCRQFYAFALTACRVRQRLLTC